MTPNERQLLQAEVDRLQSWLSCFDGPPARAGLMRSGETVAVRGMPMPNGHRIDLAALVNNFPADPPIGLYALQTDSNRALLDQLRQRFNVFDGGAAHGAPPIPGFQWLCAGYLSGWKFNIHDPARGDNLLKHFLHFYRLLEGS